MALVTSKEMFKKAYEGGYAIGAFNVNNMETIQGIVEAGKECNSPLILQVSAGARKYANPTYLKHLVEAAVQETGLPIVMHLDHGASFEMCKDAIDGGFTSVMIDASHHGFSENIGMINYADENEVFVGRDYGHTSRGYSEEVAKTIDLEVKKIIDSAYAKAKKILEDNIQVLHACASLLMEKERIDRFEFEGLFEPKPAAVEKKDEAEDIVDQAMAEVEDMADGKEDVAKDMADESTETKE